MLKHIPYDSLYKADHGWLKSRFHFSFAEYRNDENRNFGPLRVMNDDLIQGHTGFDTHPHHDMEIITYILRGKLTHEDSMGHSESLGRGDMQYLSAGTGITHSEQNKFDEEVHLIQTWIIPDKKGLKPQYGSKVFSKVDRHNKWLHLAGPQGSGSVINIYQDASMYVSELDAHKKLEFTLAKKRALYIKLIEGSAKINGTVLMQGDAAELEEESLEVESITQAHILLIEIIKEKR